MALRARGASSRRGAPKTLLAELGVPELRLMKTLRKVQVRRRSTFYSGLHGVL